MWRVVCLCLLSCTAMAAADMETTSMSSLTDDLGKVEVVPRTTLNLDDYYSYDSMMEYLKNLSDVYCCNLERRSLDTTFENRSVELVMISSEQATSVEQKKVILVDAGTHGNEWITTTVALNIMHELLVNHDENARLLESCDWYILPMVNPDGYEYSKEMKVWQKNRSPNGGLYGTNINRNYGTHWNVTDPAPGNSQEYPGSGPFSEPESKAVGNLMARLVFMKREFLYISLHTENKSIFYPSVFDSKPTKLNELFHAIAEFASAAIFEKTKSVYLPSLAYGYNGVGGTSLDYAHDIGIPLAFSFEMHPTTAEPEDKTTFIHHQVIEGWEGVKQLALGSLKMYNDSQIVTPPNSSSNPTTTPPPSDSDQTTPPPSDNGNSTTTNDASSVLGSLSLPTVTFCALLACLANALIK